MRDHVLDLRPLRASRTYRDLWAGSAVGGLGFQIANVAVLLQVWELTHSPLWTGTIGLATAVPLLTLGLVGGHLADVHDRRTLMRLAAVGQVLAAAGLAAQALAGNRSVWLLLGLVAAGAACNALGSPARRTVPPRLLPPDQVAAGLALQNLAFQVAMLVGPALAGLVLARWDLPAAYGLQAVAAVVALLGLVRLPPLPPLPGGPSATTGPAAATPEPAPRRRAAAGGWSIVWRRPTLRGAFATDVAATVLAMPVSLFPLVNEIRFDGDPAPSACSSRRSRWEGSAPASCRGRDTGAALGRAAARRGGDVGRRARRVRARGAAVARARVPGGRRRGGHGLGRDARCAGAARDARRVPRTGVLGRARGGSRRPGGRELPRGVLASLTSAPVALVAGGLVASAVVGLVAWRNAPLRRYRTPTPDPSRP